MKRKDYIFCCDQQIFRRSINMLRWSKPILAWEFSLAPSGRFCALTSCKSNCYSKSFIPSAMHLSTRWCIPFILCFFNVMMCLSNKTEQVRLFIDYNKRYIKREVAHNIVRHESVENRRGNIWVSLRAYICMFVSLHCSYIFSLCFANWKGLFIL